MSETLYRYYEEELVGFRNDSRDFSERFPATAGQLRVDRGRSSDPHVERLIEAFAFLNARVRKKLDDDFPELTDGMLSILYPHFLAPIPSMTTVQLLGQPSNSQASGIRIPKHTGLHTKVDEGLPCQFRTVYPVDLWPIEVLEAKAITAPFPAGMKFPPDANGAIVLRLAATSGFRFADLSIDKLRFHLDGDPRFVGELSEVIFNRTVEVALHADRTGDPDREVRLNATECLHEVGFAPEDAILPYPKNSFLGFQLLSELFSFPQKFAYVDLSGFDQVREKQPDTELEITFYVQDLPAKFLNEVHKGTFQLGCTPIVNLFERVCEPIQLTHKKHRYKLVPDVHHPDGMEVYSVNQVRSADPHRSVEYKPFYDFNRSESFSDEQCSEAFWYSSRDESLVRNDRGTDVFMHFVDPGFDPALPTEAALTVLATCTNRELPTYLQDGIEAVRFGLEAAIPLQEIRCLQPITPTLRPPQRRKAHWSLVSHLTLNHLSISDNKDGLAALQQILALYDFSDRNSSGVLTAVNRQMVDGITSIGHRRITRRIGGEFGGAFCRGIQIHLELDEEKYLGVGSYLFASVMRHFFTKYASLNSFVETVVTTKQREKPLRHWPPMEGAEAVL